MPRPIADRRAFTLVEVLVALAIGTMIVIGSRAMLDALGDAATRTRTELSIVDERGNATTALRQLVLNLRMPDSSAAVTRDTDGTMRFQSWCPAPGPAMERCDVRLVVRSDTDTGVTVLPAVGGALLVRTPVVPMVRFLEFSLYGGRWRADWVAGVTPPLALGVIAGVDTLVLPVGVWR